jgi:hypothetical protein
MRPCGGLQREQPSPQSPGSALLTPLDANPPCTAFQAGYADPPGARRRSLAWGCRPLVGPPSTLSARSGLRVRSAAGSPSLGQAAATRLVARYVARASSHACRCAASCSRADASPVGPSQRRRCARKCRPTTRAAHCAPCATVSGLAAPAAMLTIRSSRVHEHTAAVFCNPACTQRHQRSLRQGLDTLRLTVMIRAGRRARWHCRAPVCRHPAAGPWAADPEPQRPMPRDAEGLKKTVPARQQGFASSSESPSMDRAMPDASAHL